MSKNKLMPELRFPEFKNEEEWEEKTLGDITKIISKRNKSNKKLPIYSINNKKGFLSQDEQFEGINSSDRGYDISLYKVIERNTFAYNPARIDVGSIGFSGELHNVIISSLYVCFQAIQDVEDKFLWQFFNTFQFNRSVKNNVEGGIRNYLFYENFSRIKIAVPHTQEQQKIASCLSSLDEVISAHSQKLELLKEHKKGLVQNIFPQEGEKVPKYRFKEFEKDGEWVEKKLGELGTFIGGGTPSRSNNDYWTGEIPWISSSDIDEDDIHNILITEFINEIAVSESATKIIPIGSVLFVSRVGVGKFAINKKELCTSQDFISFVPNGILNYFIAYYFSAKKDILLSLSQGTSIKGFSKSDLEEQIIFYPRNPTEQQKIASVLSSLDELITSQTEKIEQLKLHKKGLMQGLFPKMKTGYALSKS